jgi:FkbH-like protein
LFETEIPYQRASIDDLPQEIRLKFAETARLVTHRSTNAWREHCTECAMPACYSTCELYEPRADMQCRRFRDGFVVIRSPDAAVADVMKLTFKKWAKLETKGSGALLSLNQAIRRERHEAHLGQALSAIPMPFGARVYAIKALERIKSTGNRNDAAGDISPNYFIVETFNSSSSPIHATLTMRYTGEKAHLPFQARLAFPPGYNRRLVAMTDIAAFIDLASEFLISIELDEHRSDVTLYFGLVDFAYIPDTNLTNSTTTSELAIQKSEQNIVSASLSAPTVLAKCVVWDLDNTMWKGILIEDGLEKIELNPVAIDIVRELDQRGILNSIASKNNPEDVVAALAHFGIAEYFLCPQVSWGPKSSAIKEIARRLNIGVETFAFVDDQAFERAEVAMAFPAVMSVDAADLFTLLDSPFFKVPVTAESKIRRVMYRQEVERDEAAKQSGDDYSAFLKTCDLRLTISKLSEENIERVNELTQRTNQMNFSGNRYSVKALREISNQDELDAYILRASDKFGEYGLIGFCIVNRETSCMLDLMFSCRIQHKGVDHAFLCYLLATCSSRGKSRLEAVYNETAKNRAAAQVFWDLGFEKTESNNSHHKLLYDIAARGVPHQSIVNVITE